MFSSEIWETKERAGLRQSGEYIERLISVPLNPKNKSEGYFDLYYYIHRSSGRSPALKTVLFCVGGPGQIVRPGEENFLEFLIDKRTAYQVVHFHLRGSGFSQLPPPTGFDRFLRTSYAVSDIEEIRKDVLKNEPWDGIVGYSYGTVLAQQYTAQYKEKGSRKLILIGPISMHKFKDPVIKTRAFDHYVNAVQQMRHEVLEKIVAANDEFKEKLTEDEVGDIKGQLDQTYDEIESTFGNEKFIADHYESLKDLQEWRDSRLARRRLERDFFVMLRNLRDFGWNPIDIRGVRSRQLQTFKVIAVSLKPALKAKLGDIEPSESFPYEPDYGAYRTLYAVRINDGLDRKYLKEYVAGGKQNVREALNRSPGTAGVNQYYGKVGVFNHIQEIWDPADHKHEVDTLILKGSADPVSADGQAERLFSEGLEGNKTLIEFGGVGHGFDFPFISITAPFMIGSVRIDPGRVEPGETRTVEGIIPRLARIAESDDNDNISAVRRGRQSVLESVFDFRDVIIESQNKVKVQVINPSSQAGSTEGIKLTIKHLLFRGRVTLDAGVVPAGSESWVSGTFEVEGNLKFGLEPPASLENELSVEAGSERLVLPDKLTVKITNTADYPVEGSPKNWIYRPLRGGEFEGPCQGDELYARDCIIYAFLEMENDSFRGKKREILTRIEKAKSFHGKIHIREGP